MKSLSKVNNAATENVCIFICIREIMLRQQNRLLVKKTYEKASLTVFFVTDFLAISRTLSNESLFAK